MYYTIFAKREENFLAKIDVAPLAGARIEIWIQRRASGYSLSLPSRERGLKYRAMEELNNLPLSLPSRERGLKFAFFHQFDCISMVAPLAGARIEIPALQPTINLHTSRSPRGSAD